MADTVKEKTNSVKRKITEKWVPLLSEMLDFPAPDIVFKEKLQDTSVPEGAHLGWETICFNPNLIAKIARGDLSEEILFLLVALEMRHAFQVREMHKLLILKETCHPQAETWALDFREPICCTMQDSKEIDAEVFSRIALAATFDAATIMAKEADYEDIRQTFDRMAEEEWHSKYPGTEKVVLEKLPEGYFIGPADLISAN